MTTIWESRFWDPDFGTLILGPRFWDPDLGLDHLVDLWNVQEAGSPLIMDSLFMLPINTHLGQKKKSSLVAIYINNLNI
jgi:hypothetical protein